ncbi:unnamed protein product [Rotaria sordida]|uniref:Uncharacterized protein n=1 Tax=Rotaria sordida TaxID=392033 RepID=A0A813NE77_9BILA|nr:unnamed protein product [Rotaria sordida]CAF3509541.1 unnamed protein product [Rotaria sordida]
MTNRTPSTKSEKRKKSNKKAKKKNRENIIKITLPDAAKARKTTYHKHQQQPNKNQQNSNILSSVPGISLHAPSSSTIKTVQKLPTFESKSHQSISDVQSNSISITTLKSSDQIISPTVSFNQSKTGESSPIKNSNLVNKTADNFESAWDLDEINNFTRNIFERNSYTKHIIRSNRIRLKCAIESNDYLTKYIQRQSHCLDIFEQYINTLKRSFGIIRKAASDVPIFDPGLTIMGPYVKKDLSLIDNEESHIVKRMAGIEPRKKYALVHERIGVFIIGGYNLYVNIPIQKEPDTDYLFKSNGDTVRIPRLNPCRVHFGIYSDGDAIYVVGGQTLHNEVLDDIQRLNLRTFKWEYVATLMYPLAACGMTVEGQRIYIVGGYDIFRNQTHFVNTFTIYNLSTGQFEKSTDLPSPRCRSLIFATDNALFCVSGLIEGHDENGNKKIKISTDILKWKHETPTWIKVSQTPELTKLHAVSFNDPYLEITKRNIYDDGASDMIGEAYYDFRTNIWTNGKTPALPIKHKSRSAANSPSKSLAKSPSKTQKKTKATRTKTSSTSQSTSKSKSPSKNKTSSKSKVCQHRPYECIQVSYRGINKCITNFNRLTTVGHVIDALLDDLSEKQYLSMNDCCLYIERPPYLFPLKSTDFIQDILLRYASTNIHFKLSFKRNASPSRFAQRKKLHRTSYQQTSLTNAYEQLKIQESLIRRQHEIITQLKKFNLSNDYQYKSSTNYTNYFDWITQNDDSDDSKISSDIIPICTRQSRQDEYHKAINHNTTNTSRSLSRVRFRTSIGNNRNELPSSTKQMKSILKKNSSNSFLQRTSSVDRDINRLTSIKQRRNSLYKFDDDADDDNSSDRSTTDSCLGSLSSDDNNSYVINQQHLETLV